jgi:hypothetical protein
MHATNIKLPNGMFKGVFFKAYNSTLHQLNLFLLIHSQKVIFNKKKANVKFDSDTSSGGQGK